MNKDKMIEFAKEQCEIFPEYSNMGMYLRETLKMLQAEHCTLDDAREDFVSDVYNILDFLPTNNEANRIIDVFDRVTSGLEQEPCEDCVSRAELLKIYEDRFTELQKLKHLKDNKGAEDRQMGVNYCINILKELSSVTPTRKKGKWVIKATGFPPEPMTVCSECGFDRDYYIFPRGCHKMKFCPNCGADMRGTNNE